MIVDLLVLVKNNASRQAAVGTNHIPMLPGAFFKIIVCVIIQFLTISDQIAIVVI